MRGISSRSVNQPAAKLRKPCRKRGWGSAATLRAVDGAGMLPSATWLPSGSSP
jgi:hypothetical protein